MINHAHIPGIHDVGTLFILEHREILARALFLHQGILIPAGLSAGSPVGVPPRHVIRQQTPPGIGHTHSPVGKAFQFQPWIGFLPYGADFLQTQFPGQHHPFRSQIVPRLRACIVGDGLLGADMPLTVRRIPPRQCKRPQISQNQCVHACVIQPFQMRRQLVHLAAARHGVHRYMNPDAVGVGIGHSTGQLLRGKVPGERAHAKGSARQIHGICPIQNGHLQFFHIPRRGQ